ncbi:SRPBCC family protein [Jatrophihabitans sp. YIM 134969]
MTPATISPDRYLVTATREIAAPAQALFDIVADPSMHPRLDGERSVKSTRGDVPERLSQGATFSMDMEIKARYRITNRVVEFEEGRLIAWRHFNGHRWRYTFEPLGEARTRVTEQWDARPALTRWFLRRSGFPDTAARSLPRTLENLEAVAAERG